LRWRLFVAHVQYATRFTLPSRQRRLRHAHLLRKRHRTHCSAPGHPFHHSGPEGPRVRHPFSVPSAPFDIIWVRSRGPDRGGNFPDTGGNASPLQVESPISGFGSQPASPSATTLFLASACVLEENDSDHAAARYEGADAEF